MSNPTKVMRIACAMADLREAQTRLRAAGSRKALRSVNAAIQETQRAQDRAIALMYRNKPKARMS